MARSTVLTNTSKRRKSVRVLQQMEPPTVVAPPVESVARAHRRKSSSSSSSDPSSNEASNHEPYRGIRSRTSTRVSQENDRKQPPASSVLSNSTNTKGGRKRTASKSNCSAQKKNKKTKGNNYSLSLSTQAASNGSTTTGPPMTRRQRQLMLNQVTPSPASNPTSPAFSFDSPLPKKRLAESSLPRGVIDLYPTKSSGRIHCNCDQQYCSSLALTASYIQDYGKEYWQIMKDNDEPVIVPPSPAAASSGARSSTFSSPDSTSCDDSFCSHATPARRRDYVHIDTSHLEVAEPNESTKFLHYQPELTPKMRAILVDWIIELSEHFNFGPATLHLAITLVDKMLACGPLSMMMDDPYDDDEEDDSDNDDGESKTNCFLISRERFQLLGAACTWLACKFEELNPPNVSEIAYVSDNIYTTEQIKRMERRICSALNFSLCHQTPHPYVFEFLRASNECPNPYCRAGSTPVVQNLVLYLLELGRLPYSPVTKKPSLLAAAAMYLARCTLGIRDADNGSVWTRTLEYYTGYSQADLKDTVLAIHGYHLAAEGSSLKSVFSKYKSKKYHRVALKTVPRVEDLGF